MLVAHLDGERVLRLGAVEGDAADVVGADLVRGAPAAYRLVVRMLTTETPEPRPPTLCWSAYPLRIST